jgi:cysteine desulfurase/selenocysteine lyase
MTVATTSFDIQKIRQDFPILHQQVFGKPLVYLDNAATAQKPKTVIEAIEKYYSFENANIHRGVHHLSQEATTAFEESRQKIQKHLGAANDREIIFTSGTTDAINLVASTWGRVNVKKGDEIILSEMEHHSNIVPWQMLAEEKGALIKVIPVSDSGELNLDAFESLLSSKTRMVAVNHISNSLGTINPIEEIIEKAHAAGAKVLIDGAQAVPHARVDVKQLDCDFYTFSGHKVFGPTGIGILYGKEEILEEMPPYRGGGEMIKTVSFDGTTYNELPHKFEAGTPHIAGGIALGTAIDYLNEIGLENIQAYEHSLLEYATEKLSEIEGLKIYGTAKNKTSVISFLIDGTHPYDVGAIIDKLGIAVRTGHHCCQPLMDRFEIPGTLRASFAFYNTKEEVDLLVAALERAVKMLR